MQSIFDNLYAQSKDNFIFTNLYDIIIQDENIKLAYRNIKRNVGSHTAGVNHKTIKDWEQVTVEDYTQYVKKRLRNYFPHKVKRVEIPKPNGKTRPLGIPTMEDRLIQQCIKQVLEPILEAKFHPQSHGFRPNRSTMHAVSEFVRSVNLGNCYWVIDIDIRGFFDNVDHAKLLKQLWTLGIQDKRLISILSKMLKAEIDGIGKPEKGTPQGGILSPLLANVVLNELDWWIDSQWRTFEIEETKPYIRKDGEVDRSNVYTKLRATTSLKEMKIVRYADDFKILCKKKSDATYTFIAVKEWLKDRLGLEINEEKSKVVNIRNTPSEFLGFTFICQRKNKKLILFSHLTHKSKENAIKKLKESIVEIRKSPTMKNVSRYNSVVLGLQNYYRTATYVNQDFSEIDYKIHAFRYNQLKNLSTESGEPSKTYKKIYKGYNYKKMFVAGICLFPVSAIKHKYPIGFQQDICDYTVEGRLKTHDNLKIDVKTLHYLMDNPLDTDSIELADNRISLYSAQYGRCYITNEELEIGNMEIHHKKPVHMGGGDEYKNLVWVTFDIHKLIHATTELTINKYLKKFEFDSKQLEKLNILRKLSGNCVIEQ